MFQVVKRKKDYYYILKDGELCSFRLTNDELKELNSKFSGNRQVNNQIGSFWGIEQILMFDEVVKKKSFHTSQFPPDLKVKEVFELESIDDINYEMMSVYPEYFI